MLQPGEDPPSRFHLSCVKTPIPWTPAIPSPSSPLRSFRSNQTQTESSAIRFPLFAAQTPRLPLSWASILDSSTQGLGAHSFIATSKFLNNPLTSPPRHHQQPTSSRLLNPSRSLISSSLAFSVILSLNPKWTVLSRHRSRLKQIHHGSPVRRTPRQGVGFASALIPLCHPNRMYPPRFRHFHPSHIYMVFFINPMKCAASGQAVRPIQSHSPILLCRLALTCHVLPIRLYQAPVESDVQSKSAADKSSAEARSSIRRRRLQASELRQQRRRRLAITAAINSGNAAAAAASYSYDNPRRRSPPAERSSGSSSDSSNNAESNRDTARDGTVGIAGMLDDQVVALFGRRLAHLHSMSQYPGALTDDEDSRPDSYLTAEPPFAHMAVEPGFLSRRLPPPPPPQLVEHFTSSQHGQTPPYPVRASSFSTPCQSVKWEAKTND